MKKVFFSFLLIVCLQGFSQFSIHTLFPLSIKGIAYSDTVLHSPILLKSLGIKKVKASFTTVSGGIQTIGNTEYLINDGKIAAGYSCLYRLPDRKIIYCNSDTFLYDVQGRLTEINIRTAGRATFMQGKTDYLSANAARQQWITLLPHAGPSDTSLSYLFFNDKGQLIRQEQKPKNGGPVNAMLYYNEDGLPDSIRHDNPKWGTYIFKRRPKKQGKEITLETPTTEYKWEYNAAGQCVASESASKQRFRMPDQSSSKLKVEAKYVYNSDGSLAKVVETLGRETTTSIYSYEK